MKTNQNDVDTYALTHSYGQMQSSWFRVASLLSITDASSG